MLILKRCRRAALITLFAALAAAPAQAAEPLTLFILKMLRDQMATAAIESTVNAAAAAQAKPAAPALGGVYGITEEQLRGLIDTGFVHLSPVQRGEVYAGVMRMLADPRNAGARALIIEELALQASIVRGAHERLAALTPAEKRMIAADARSEYERLPLEERAQLLQLLRSGIAPIPRDLNELILAEFSATGAALRAAVP